MSAVDDNSRLVRRAWEAALRGDLETVAGLLADDVRWHAAGYEDAGCHNRPQALRWMRAAIEGGATAELLELRELDDHRVLAVLRRAGAPEPHAQVVTVRDGKIAEMVVYPALSLVDD
jgi:ketosteroid isomerase-like protein